MTDLAALIEQAAKYGDVPEQVRLYATNRRYMPVGYGREAMLRLADDATANLLALVVKQGRMLDIAIDDYYAKCDELSAMRPGINFLDTDELKPLYRADLAARYEKEHNAGT